MCHVIISITSSDFRCPPQHKTPSFVFGSNFKKPHGAVYLSGGQGWGETVFYSQKTRFFFQNNKMVFFFPQQLLRAKGSQGGGRAFLKDPRGSRLRAWKDCWLEKGCWLTPPPPTHLGHNFHYKKCGHHTKHLKKSALADHHNFPLLSQPCLTFVVNEVYCENNQFFLWG